LSSSATPTIAVDQPSALYDTPVTIVVEGLMPGNRVTLTATFHIPGSVPWRSHAMFAADANGRVDLTRQAPVAGTYNGVAAMGLFWSPTPVTGETPAAPDSVMQPQIVRLDAQASGVSPAQMTLERRWAGPGVTRHEMTRRFTILPGRLTGPRSTKSRSRIPTVGRSSAGTGSWIAISVVRPFRISFARSDDGGIAGLVINPGTWPIPATRVSCWAVFVRASPPVSRKRRT
jgi:acyl-CoA thioester hydrolase/bile acid acetyltransferase-like protein